MCLTLPRLFFSWDQYLLKLKWLWPYGLRWADGLPMNYWHWHMLSIRNSLFILESTALKCYAVDSRSRSPCTADGAMCHIEAISKSNRTHPSALAGISRTRWKKQEAHHLLYTEQKKIHMYKTARANKELSNKIIFNAAWSYWYWPVVMIFCNAMETTNEH